MKCPSARRRGLQRRWKLRSTRLGHKLPKSTEAQATVAALRQLPEAEQRKRLLELLRADLSREEDVDDQSWRMPHLDEEARTASAGDSMSFETRFCWIRHLGDAELQRMLRTCRLVFALDGSSWMPCNETPRCFAERLAMAIFEHHTAGCEFDPARSGAEWWSQVRQSGHREEGIQFHWDTDEVAVERHNVNVHPHLSTVTYLSDLGAPTLVLSCRNSRRPSETSSAYGSLPQGALSWPRMWKHLVFDGQLLHGTAPAVEDGPQGQRVTFLVNIWLNHRPSNCKRLAKSLSKRLGDGPLPHKALSTATRPPCLRSAEEPSSVREFRVTFGRRKLAHQIDCHLPKSIPPEACDSRTVLLDWSSQTSARLGPAGN